MDVKEIDAKIAELQAMKAKAEEDQKEKEAQMKFDEAVEIYARLIEDIRRLDVLGYTPPRLAKALTDETGKFNPGMYIKRPRAPLRHI